MFIIEHYRILSMLLDLLRNTTRNMLHDVIGWPKQIFAVRFLRKIFAQNFWPNFHPFVVNFLNLKKTVCTCHTACMCNITMQYSMCMQYSMHMQYSIAHAKCNTHTLNAILQHPMRRTEQYVAQHTMQKWVVGNASIASVVSVFMRKRIS